MPPTMMRLPLSYRSDAGSNRLPPNQVQGSPSVSTFSRKVTSAVSVRLTRVLRTISARRPGLSRQRRCSRWHIPKVFPVPAGPSRMISGSVSQPSCWIAPRGLNRMMRSTGTVTIEIYDSGRKLLWPIHECVDGAYNANRLALLRPAHRPSALNAVCSFACSLDLRRPVGIV